MKKVALLYSLIFIIVCACCSLSVFAENEDGGESYAKPTLGNKTGTEINISFKIGESKIKVNNKEIEDEKPFVENDITLVPLRVITEAFGARVEWKESEKNIILSYDDIEIKLWIGKTEATIGDKKIDLQTAPVIINDKTMVPIRFITENFGADVSFDSETKQVKVVKEVANESSIKDFARILKTTTKEKVGDSYYGWTIKLPKKLKMEHRSFNGKQNNFDSKDFGVSISIEEKGRNTIESIKAHELKNAKSFSLVDQGIKTINDYTYFFMVVKMYMGITEIRYCIKDDKLYIISAIAKDLKTYKESPEIKSALDSFNLSFIKDDNTEDLSDVNANGYRAYKNKKLKLSTEILADWNERGYSRNENEVAFAKAFFCQKQNHGKYKL